jgi:hypothetical protein
MSTGSSHVREEPAAYRGSSDGASASESRRHRVGSNGPHHLHRRYGHRAGHLPAFTHNVGALTCYAVPGAVRPR